MSKKKRKVQRLDVKQAVHQSLHTDFFFTEDDIELFDNALEGRAPTEIVEQIKAIHEGKVSFPEAPGIALDMGDGTIQHLTLTNHPMNLLLDYLVNKFGMAFGGLYWSALTSPPESSYKEFFKYIQLYKKTRAFTKDRIAFEERKASKRSNVEEG